MNLATKQRTIGVIILLIIFSWIGIILYRQHGHTTIPAEMLVPDVPKAPQTVLDEMETLQKNQLTAQKSSTPSIQVSTVSTPVVNKTHTTSIKVPSAWVIQLATFSNKKNAQTLLLKVRKQGYDAFSRDVTTIKGKRLIKIFVGPNISYNRVKQMQNSLEARYHLRGMIQTYHVDSISNSYN